MHEIRKKVPYFYASAASLILCLAIFWWSVNRNEERSRKMVEMANNLLTHTNQMLSDVSTALDDLSEEESKYETATKILARRSDWFDIYNELQRILPYNMWLVKIAPAEAPSKENTESSSGGGMGGFRGLFRSTTSAATTVKASPDVEWIELTGHTLKMKEKKLMEEVFKENIIKSPYFTEQKETDFKPGLGVDNLTRFTMLVKLKKPIKR
jgi:hypothetical protein